MNEAQQICNCRYVSIYYDIFDPNNPLLPATMDFLSAAVMNGPIAIYFPTVELALIRRKEDSSENSVR